MKTAALLLLSACVQTTTTFTPRPDSRPEDIHSLINAVNFVNGEAGCSLFSVNMLANPNVTFSTNKKCYDELVNEDAYGLTEIGGIEAPQLCLHSFYAYPMVYSWNGYEHGTKDAAAVVTYLHEMGHAAGLEHTKNRADIMFGGFTGEYDDGAISRFVEQLADRAGVSCQAKKR